MVTDWFIPLLNLIALWLAVQKRKETFVVFTIANAYWFYYHISHKTYEFLAVLVIYQIFNIWGYLKWKKGENKNERKISGL